MKINILKGIFIYIIKSYYLIDNMLPVSIWFIYMELIAFTKKEGFHNCNLSSYLVIITPTNVFITSNVKHRIDFAMSRVMLKNLLAHD